MIDTSKNIYDVLFLVVQMMAPPLVTGLVWWQSQRTAKQHKAAMQKLKDDRRSKVRRRSDATRGVTTSQIDSLVKRG